ncbi:phosphatidylglycerophosphate phosphatase PTPMT1 [Phoenix dactylifera]|uniref:phosphatidylglycerophosphatase n=1 Tax=Phoenix dactylifera TaxID=42345 RepID=A0A8B7CMQ4_PHODC|nr:phosphatidylglycerophosphate phosphatase PTPMT1 [Phoenix dactylifera]
MYIEELTEGDSGGGGGGEGGGRGRGGEGESSIAGVNDRKVELLDAKRAVVGVGARVLFYPTLLYNVLRNKIQSEFRWWDEVDQFLLLGAVPFPSDVPRLKQLGVCGVVTLNEPYETLVPTSLYLDHGIEHLVIPTRDYLFAPLIGDICRAVDFIHENASSGKTTYVHCKAGRGRSTTIVLCYLVQHRHMTPRAAYQYVRLSRPRVLLASSQWQAVQEYYRLKVKNSGRSSCLDSPIVKSPALVTTRNLVAFEDSSFVVVSESDLDGYDGDVGPSNVGSSIWAELSLAYRVQFASQAAIARLSCFWLGCEANQEILLTDKVGRESCSLEADQLGSGHPCLLQGMVVKL